MFLRQGTASQEISLGHFLDSVDGNTEKTALTIANTDIKLWKHGATVLVNKNSGGATHMANGIYSAVLDATDTDTLGNLTVFVHVATALVVKATFVVLPAAVFDSLVLGLSGLPVNAQGVWEYGTRTLTAGIVPAVSPVNPATLEVRIIRGDDYVAAPLQFTGMPNLTGSTQILFKIGDLDMAALGTEPSCTYAAGTVSVALSRDVTQALARSKYHYTLEATLASEKRTVAQGNLFVTGKVKDAP